MAVNLMDAIIAGAAKSWIIGKLKDLRGDKQAMTFLSGYKTYIVALLLILIGVAEYLGFSIPGVSNDPTGFIGSGIGLVFARGGATADAKKAEAGTLTK